MDLIAIDFSLSPAVLTNPCIVWWAQKSPYYRLFWLLLFCCNVDFLKKKTNNGTFNHHNNYHNNHHNNHDPQPNNWIHLRIFVFVFFLFSSSITWTCLYGAIEVKLPPKSLSPILYLTLRHQHFSFKIELKISHANLFHLWVNLLTQIIPLISK